MPPKLSEVELLLNKAALHQARLREALGFKPEAVDDAELRRQEEALFKCEPEFAGVGYRAKDDPAAELKRKAASSDDKLRRQLLGKNSKPSSTGQLAAKGKSKIGTVSRESDSDDDEEGRAASFKSKRRKLVTDNKSPAASTLDAKLDDNFENKQPLSINANEKGSDQSAAIVSSRRIADKSPKRAAPTYLDELLAQKARKRKKHKKSKGGDAGDQKS